MPTARHLFVRWDDPAGERVNIEISSNTGLNTYPDDYYKTWPVPIKGTQWEEMFPLRSLLPREEVARAWGKRGHCLYANGRLREAVQCFATACSVVTDNRLLDMRLFDLLKKWQESLTPRIPAKTPTLRIYFPPKRRYPDLPADVERKVIELEVLEGLLDQPIPDVDRVVRCVLN